VPRADIHRDVRPSPYMRFFALACGLLAAVGAVVTAIFLGLAYIPQESSGPASGEWGYALLPGVPSAALAWLAVALWRNSD
jgi:hypothetical protein